jgi:hypothetical protein
MSFMFQFILAFKVVMAFQGLGNGVGFFWYDYDMDDGADDAAGVSQPREKFYQTVDDTTSWILVCAWVFSHALLICDAVVRNWKPRNVMEVNSGFLDKRIRSSWKSKMEKIRDPLVIMHGENPSVTKQGIDI